MSTQIPLRIARSHAHSMRRQCLFQRRTAPSTPRCVTATSARAFSSTPAQLRQKDHRLIDTRLQVASSEATIMGHASPTAQTNQDTNELAEDIGLLQNTLIRAPFSKLPSPASWQFYSYFWSLLKARFTALYTRSHFKRCAYKSGITSYLPVDFMKQKQLTNQAKKMYKRYYELLAAGDVKSLGKLCLPPLSASLRSQIAARSSVRMTWTLHKFKSARIVSHRCAPVGGEQPDTSYRQCIVRIESEQQLSVTPVGVGREVHKTRAPKWVPSNAPKTDVASATAGGADAALQTRDAGKTQTVVEYLVMQTRVVQGKEEDWKVWGFASESTPAKIEEDEQYWKRMLDTQAAT